LTPSPPASFPEVERLLLPEGKILNRIDGRAFAPGSFNPASRRCRGRITPASVTGHGHLAISQVLAEITICDSPPIFVPTRTL